MLPQGYAAALGALSAGHVIRLAIDTLGYLHGQGHLAHMRRPGDEVGVGQAPSLQAAIQLTDGCFVTGYAPQGLGWLQGWLAIGLYVHYTTSQSIRSW